VGGGGWYILNTKKIGGGQGKTVERRSYQRGSETRARKKREAARGLHLHPCYIEDY